MTNNTPSTDSSASPSAARLDTTTLDGLQLNWAAACYDPSMKGLKLTLVEGVLCGVDENDPAGLVCVYLHQPRFVARLQASRKLGARGEHAVSYDPLDDWRQAGKLLRECRIEVGPDGDELWRARSGEHEVLGQPTAQHAMLRAFVLKHAGPTIDVPLELAAVLLGSPAQPKAA